MADVAKLQAVILAAGEGDRLGGIYPKPFTPVNGVPVVSRLLRQLPPVPTRLVVREQDRELAEYALAIADRLDGVGAGTQLVEIVPQPPAPPDARVNGAMGVWSVDRQTIVVLGDNVYWPSIPPIDELLVCDFAIEEGVVATKPVPRVHGIEHDDSIVTGRRWRGPHHDIGIYLLPPGAVLGRDEKDRSVLGGMLASDFTTRYCSMKQLTWFDIGTPADLARADLFLRAKEGPCGS